LLFWAVRARKSRRGKQPLRLRAVNKRLRARSMSQSNHRCEALGRVVDPAAYLNDVAVDRDDRFPRRDGCSSNVTINDTSAASVK
jgi:hypothetical protein